MTRVALITDLHFGARDDSTVFHDFYERFYVNTFFPSLLAHGIKTVIVLGDVFDRRKYVNYRTLDRSRRMFFDRLVEHDIKAYFLVGNHDTFFKNTNALNSLHLNLAEYPFEIISGPREIDIGGHTLCMLPWICDDNIDASMALIGSTKATLAFGHLEVAGFAMYKGMVSKGGLDRKMFDKFEMVFSGHYHHRSTDGTIFYLGNPYELTWQDFDDPRGFHIFDLDSRELEFIENPFKMFHKVLYNDIEGDIKYVDKVEIDHCKDAYVKVIVQSKNEPMWFDLFIERIEKLGVADLQVVDDHLNLGSTTDEIVAGENVDTVKILDQYVDNMDSVPDKPALELYLRDLYREAVEVGAHAS